MSASAKKTYRPETRLVQSGTLALAIRRNVRGDVSDSRLCLRHRGAGRGALQGRRSRLSVFALRQSDRRHVRAAHGGVRRRRGRARHRHRHGRGHHLAGRPAQGRRSRGGVESHVRLLPLRRRGLSAALRRRLDLGRRLQSRRLEKCGAAEHQDVLSRKPDQSGARSHRHRRSGEDRARGRRHLGGRQCVRHAAVPEPARARRRLRRLFGDQAHRRAGALPRRRRARLAEIHHGQDPCADPPDRAVDVAVQRLGAAQEPGDARGARAAADRQRRDCRGGARRASRRSRA